MIQAIGGASNFNDYEYMQILNELRQLGIAPSGNKSADKSKLEKAKLELVQKINEKQEEDTKQQLQIQPIKATDEVQRTQIENERIGAMTVAELNKIYFGLL